jgi:hypothetical protein
MEKDPKDYPYYQIYSLSPAPWGDDYRLVETFDTKEDAESVLKALEEVNILLNCYKIVVWPRIR